MIEPYRYIAHACGRTRSITHVFLWRDTFYHPATLRYFTHETAPQGQCWRGFQKP